MSQQIPMAVPGTLGNIAGSAADGVLIGQLTATNPTKAMLKNSGSAALCYTDDGGLYVDETAALLETTADDVEVLPATPAVDDACYFGHASKTFASISLNTTTQGAGTWTITWEYWNGSAWTALAGVTDGTTGFTSATGWVNVTYTLPTDWAQCTVDGVNGYWVRGRVSAYTAVTTAPQVGQGYLTASSAVWTDDLTDFTDAGAGDVALLPTFPSVGDGFYVGYTEKFCKIKLTTSQARTGTATLALKYWDGSAWTAVPAVDDDSVGYSATAGTHFIHFAPPADWVANTVANGPNGQAGYFVVMELTVLTDVTQQPLGTQGWVYPLVTGASGIKSPVRFTTFTMDMDAQTVSATNADSIFTLVNTTTGKHATITWTKGDGHDSDSGSLIVAKNDQLALIQVTEDGTTEFANANFALLAN